MTRIIDVYGGDCPVDKSVMQARGIAGCVYKIGQGDGNSAGGVDKAGTAAYLSPAPDNFVEMVYWLLDPRTKPSIQVNLMVKAISAKTPAAIWMDIELPYPGCSPATYDNFSFSYWKNVYDFREGLKAAFPTVQTIGMYTGWDFWNNVCAAKIPDASLAYFSGVPLWYATEAFGNPPALPKGFSKWMLNQVSESVDENGNNGKYYGISNLDVDLDDWNESAYGPFSTFFNVAQPVPAPTQEPAPTDPTSNFNAGYNQAIDDMTKTIQGMKK